MRPKPRCGHAVDHAANHLHRGRHVHHHALDEGVAVDLAEVAAGRTAVVVDEDVGLGHRLDQGGLNRGLADVACDRMHGDAGLVADRLRRLLEGGAVAPVDDEVHPVPGERDGAAPPEPAASGADDGAAPLDTEIHGSYLPCSGDILTPAGPVMQGRRALPNVHHVPPGSGRELALDSLRQRC